MDPKDCTLIIPASGFSLRFGKADKLLADLNGQPLASYAAQTAASLGFSQMIAVIPPGHVTRSEIFKAHGFCIVDNTEPKLGQARSIQIGVKAVRRPVRAICIVLADMPFVPAKHIRDLLRAAPENGVIRTLYKGHFQPPAIFTGQAAQVWMQGKQLLDPPNFEKNIDGLRLSEPMGEDVDTEDDLKRLSDLGL